MKGMQVIEEMQEERRKNNDTSPFCLVDCPLTSDVVFQAGTTNIAHPGNTTYRDMLLSHFGGYSIEQANASKKEIVNTIMQDVIGRGGRFLEWNSVGCWTVIRDPAKLQVKIYHSLYQLQKTAEAKKRTQSSSSSTFIFERQDGRKRKRSSADGTNDACCARCLT